MCGSAETTFAFLTAATNVPLTAMMFIDGRAYAVAGIAGMLAVDALIGIAACILAGILLAKYAPRASRSAIETTV